MESGGLFVMISLDKLMLMWHVASWALILLLRMEMSMTWGIYNHALCIYCPSLIVYSY